MENTLKNMLKNNILLNILIFVLLNIFFIDYYLPFMLLFHIPKQKQYAEFLNIFAIFYVFFTTINRLYLLPIYFKSLLKYTKCQEIKFLIQDIKESLHKKLVVLLITFIIPPFWGALANSILNCNYSITGFVGSLQLGIIFAPFIGLYQAYLILFIYWWLEDIWRKYQSKKS